MNQQALKKKLSQTADQCVKCGLCLPHCPTYRLIRDEAESPRGRIALIQGLAEDQLANSERLQTHLANCLECRACETVCPSLVQFGSLMDDARSLGNQESDLWHRLSKRALLRTLSSAAGARVAALSSTFYRATGLARLVERTSLVQRPILGAIHRMAMQLGRSPKLPAPTEAPSVTGEEIDLFLGCVARAAQPRALEAARRVLERLGFRVRIPRRQGCCGAMLRHNGFPEEADRLLGRTAAATSRRTIVGIASACVAELKTHPELSETQEICRFLAELRWPQDMPLRPLPQQITVHEPCSHRNQLRDGSAAYDLLRHIPELEPVGLADNAFCCGAAGTYLLQQPALSQALLAPKLAALADLGTDILVTTNTGCALHLAAGVRDAGLKMEVLHPIELIARQLGDWTPAPSPTRVEPS